MNEQHTVLKVLDLFSGIGGFSLGLERTSRFRTVAFCEIDPFARRVLKKHWPEVPIYGDIRSLKGSDVGPVDVVCGGFPCQPFSTASAGKRRGIEDDRFLWPEMCRIVDECRPTWVCGENVVGINALALEHVVSDLEAIGYEVAPPLEIPACALGYDHWRPRFWFLAYANSNSKPSSAINAKVAVMPRRGSDSGSLGTSHGLSSGLHRSGGLDANEMGSSQTRSTYSNRLKALGNSVVPQIPEMIGRAILRAVNQHEMRNVA